MQLETERKNLEESSGALTAAERKLILLQNELADLQAQLAAVYSYTGDIVATAYTSVFCYHLCTSSQLHSSISLVPCQNRQRQNRKMTACTMSLKWSTLTY